MLKIILTFAQLKCYQKYFVEYPILLEKCLLIYEQSNPSQEVIDTIHQIIGHLLDISWEATSTGSQPKGPEQPDTMELEPDASRRQDPDTLDGFIAEQQMRRRASESLARSINSILLEKYKISILSSLFHYFQRRYGKESSSASSKKAQSLDARAILILERVTDQILAGDQISAGLATEIVTIFLRFVNKN